MLWIKRAGYLALVVGGLVMLGDIIRNGLFITGALIFAAGIVLLLIAASISDSITKKTGVAFQILRALLVVGLLLSLPASFIVGFGLSGVTSNDLQSIAELVFSVPIPLGLVCLTVALVLKNKGKVTLAVSVLVLPFIWGILGGITLLVYLG